MGTVFLPEEIPFRHISFAAIRKDVEYFFEKDFYETRQKNLNGGVDFSNSIAYESGFSSIVYAKQTVNLDETSYLLARLNYTDVPYAIVLIVDYDGNGLTDSMSWVVGNCYGGTTGATNTVYDLKELLDVSGKHNINVGFLWHGRVNTTVLLHSKDTSM